jgi:hypothetical protein
MDTTEVIAQFGKQLTAALDDLSRQLDCMRNEKNKLEAELLQLTLTAAQVGTSRFLVEAIHEREQRLGKINDKLLSGEPGSVQACLQEIRSFVVRKLSDLRPHYVFDQTGEWIRK